MEGFEGHARAMELRNGGDAKAKREGNRNAKAGVTPAPSVKKRSTGLVR
jgi:hypothetical protein